MACRLFGRWPALTFHNAVTSDDGHAVIRVWTIGPGLLARRADSFGSLLLGAESRTGPNGRDEWRIWVEVKDYPSRFLPQAPTSHAVRVWIARLYLAAHGWVTGRYLDRLAAILQQGAPQ